MIEIGQRVRKETWIGGVYLDVEWVEDSMYDPHYHVCGMMTRGTPDARSRKAVSTEPVNPWIVINAACQTCHGLGLVGVRMPGEHGGEAGAEYDYEPCSDCDRACEFCGEQKAAHTETERMSCIVDGAEPWGATQ